MANRGGELLDQFTVDDWQHVKDTMNPTDSGPRAVTVSQLLESELFDGPAWLRQHPGSWPDQVKLVDIYDIALMTTPTESVIDWSRFSKYKQKVEVIVHCLRLRSKQRGEIWRKNAERLILQIPQRESFALPNCSVKMKTTVERKWSMSWQNFPHLMTVTTQYDWRVD